MSDAYYTLVQQWNTPFFGIADAQGNMLCNYAAMDAISGYNHTIYMTINSNGVFEHPATSSTETTIYMYKFI